MATNLVIMESPSKAITVKGYLGSNYKVIASIGHVRDLPKSTFGIDIENGFKPHYINIRGKGELIEEIRKEAKKASKIYLATDPDREGEAIAWHLAETLNIPIEKTKRVCFNEITKNVVREAIKNPRPIDMNLVDAQQARRGLDRIVGYKLSPLLWKNIKNGLSAGRVQSVATRIIVEREEEIKAFKPEEYWSIKIELANNENKKITAYYYGNDNGKNRLTNQKNADVVVANLQNNQIVVKDVKKSTKKKTPAAPFTTSTLQQEAFKKLGFQTSKTMKIAQELYEGINLGATHGGSQGLITYMRTDSVRVSSEAQEQARKFICEKYGNEYCPKTIRNYKTKASAQDAHEAIRPANIQLEPSQIKAVATNDQYKLYKLIWECFIASQMECATLDSVSISFNAGKDVYQANGYTISFQGYMALYEASDDEIASEENGEKEVKGLKFPEVKIGEILQCKKISPTQHFTEAPARYNDASLVKILKDMDIGRPSTYATIITTILSREYVKREGKSFVPTQLGEVINQLMNQHFAEIMEYKFTAGMEKKLDDVEEGKISMQAVLEDFWKRFEKQLNKAEQSIQKVQLSVEETDIVCERCGSKMIIKNGKFGKFAACPNYPKCKNTKALVEPKKEMQEEPVKKVASEEVCEKCGSPLVQKSGKFGTFLACSRYPECDFTKTMVEQVSVPCPKCGGKILARYGKKKNLFYGCENYPKCNFAAWDMPTFEVCPTCGGMLLEKKQKNLLICINKDCDYTRSLNESLKK